MAMLRSSTMEERTLCWLSLDTHVRALAERLLERVTVTGGDAPRTTTPSPVASTCIRWKWRSML